MTPADMIPLLAPLRAEATEHTLTVWFDLDDGSPVEVIVNAEKFPPTASTSAYIDRIAANLGEHVNRHDDSGAEALARWSALFAMPLPPRLRYALCYPAEMAAKAMLTRAESRMARTNVHEEIAAAIDDRAAAKRLDALSDEVWAQAIRESAP